MLATASKTEFELDHNAGPSTDEDLWAGAARRSRPSARRPTASTRSSSGCASSNRIFTGRWCVASSPLRSCICSEEQLQKLVEEETEEPPGQGAVDDQHA